MDEAIHLRSVGDGDVETQSTQRSLRHAEARNLKEIFESSSISGLPKIIGARNPYSRLFWTILLIAGIVGFAVNMYYLTLRFISEPVLNIRVAEHERFVWPEIVVCNPMNPLPFWRYNTTAKWEALRNRTKNFHNWEYNFIKLVNYEHVVLMSSINPEEYGIHRASNIIPFWQIKFDNPGIGAFTNAYYGHAYTPVPDTSHFKSWQHVMLFPTPCYSLSTSTQPVLTYKDRFHVLREVLLPISTIEKDYEKFGCHVDDRGVHLYVIPVNRTIPDRRTALLVPGSKVKVSLRMHRTERLKKKTNCLDSKFEIELFDTLFQTSRVFKGTYSDCMNFVTQRLFLESCKCYNPFLPIHRSNQYPPKLCLNATLFSDAEVRANLNCMNKVLLENMDRRRKKYEYEETVNRECGQFKRPPCEEVSYSVNMESSEISENVNKRRELFATQIAQHLPGLKAGDSLQKIKKNVILLSIAKANDFGSYNAQEFEYETAQFISDVGGIVGLWIGLSVVGFFELFEMLFASIRYAVVIRSHSTGKTRSV